MTTMNDGLFLSLSQRREKLKQQAKAIGYNLDYDPEVLMEDIRLLPDSYWHNNRSKGWGGSNEGVLNNLSKYSTLTELVNEKLISKKAIVDSDKQFTFDFGHALEWVMLKRYASINNYKFLTYCDNFLLIETKDDVKKKFPMFKKAQEGIYSYVTRDNSEALELLGEVKKVYPNAKLIYQESNDPKDIRDISQEEHDLYDELGIVCVDRRQYVNPNYTSMLGDMDGLCITPDGNKIGLECKTYNYNSPKGCFASGVLGETGRVKNEEYYYQVQHYMAVCNIDRFDILACCGNTASDFTCTTVFRDVDFEKYLCENAQDSWTRYIENLETPEESSLTEEQHNNLINAISPELPITDEELEVPSNLLENIEKIEQYQQRLTQLSQEKDTIEEQIRLLKLPIEETMINNTKGLLKTSHDYDYQLKFEPSSGRAGFDTNGLLSKFPEIWEQFRKPAKAGTRKLTFKRVFKK